MAIIMAQNNIFYIGCSKYGETGEAKQKMTYYYLNVKAADIKGIQGVLERMFKFILSELT